MVDDSEKTSESHANKGCLFCVWRGSSCSRLRAMSSDTMVMNGGPVSKQIPLPYISEQFGN